MGTFVAIIACNIYFCGSVSVRSVDRLSSLSTCLQVYAIYSQHFDQALYTNSLFPDKCLFAICGHYQGTAAVTVPKEATETSDY